MDINEYVELKRKTLLERQKSENSEERLKKLKMEEQLKKKAKIAGILLGIFVLASVVGYSVLSYIGKVKNEELVKTERSIVELENDIKMFNFQDLNNKNSALGKKSGYNSTTVTKDTEFMKNIMQRMLTYEDLSIYETNRSMIINKVPENIAKQWLPEPRLFKRIVNGEETDFLKVQGIRQAPIEFKAQLVNINEDLSRTYLYELTTSFKSAGTDEYTLVYVGFATLVDDSDLANMDKLKVKDLNITKLNMKERGIL